MSSLILSCAILALLLGGIFLGFVFRRILPGNHVSKETQEVVRLGAGLIATIAALVLGLLITAAKSSSDTKSTQINQLTANLILLDSLLSQYGPEAIPIRALMRDAVGPLADRLWQDKAGMASFTPSSEGEKLYLGLNALSPRNEMQQSLKNRAIQVSADLARIRLLLFVESNNRISAPFLAILVFWLVVIFASFSLFSELNATALTFLCVFALSAACAIFLILELNEPFSGLMMISDAPLRHALPPLGQQPGVT